MSIRSADIQRIKPLEAVAPAPKPQERIKEPKSSREQAVIKAIDPAGDKKVLDPDAAIQAVLAQPNGPTATTQEPIADTKAQKENVEKPNEAGVLAGSNSEPLQKKEVTSITEIDTGETQEHKNIIQKAQETASAALNLLKFQKAGELINHFKHDQKMQAIVATAALGYLAKGVGLDPQQADIIAGITTALGGAMGFSDFRVISKGLERIIGENMQENPSTMRKIGGVTARAGDYVVGGLATYGLGEAAQMFGGLGKESGGALGIADDFIAPIIRTLSHLRVSSVPFTKSV